MATPSDHVRTFHWADYVVFGASLLVSACIGIYYRFTGERQKTTREFLLGGKTLSPLPVAFSLQASFMSAIFILGTPAEIYMNGTMYAWIFFCYFLSFPIAAQVYLPIFHKLDLTSAHEYLELRFNKWIRLLGSMTFALMMLLYMAVVLYAPALAFSQVTGLSTWISILGIGLVCTFYTVLGGLKAVVWTDAFQMLVIFVGILTLLIQGTISVGGIEEVWQIASNGSRFQWDQIGIDPRERHTVWTQIFGGAVMTLTLYAVNQTMIQRYLSIKKTRDAQIAVYGAMVSTALNLVLCTLLGLVMYAFYEKCDPLTSGIVNKSDQLIPLFVMDVMGTFHGLPGLFTACTFAAALSTVSSGVNSLAAVFLIDVIQPSYKWYTLEEMKDTLATNISKMLALTFGLITVGLGFAASKMGNLILQLALSIFGVVGGPLLGLFSLAIFFPCANSIGAAVGLIISLAFMIWLQIGAILHGSASDPLDLRTDGCEWSDVTNSTIVSYSQEYTTHLMYDTTQGDETDSRSTADEFYSISYMWYSVIGAGSTLIIGLIFSLITGCNKKKHKDRALMYNCANNCCCCLPKKARDVLQCGMDQSDYLDDDVHLEKILGLERKSSFLYRVDSQDVCLSPLDRDTGIINECYKKYIDDVTRSHTNNSEKLQSLNDPGLKMKDTLLSVSDIRFIDEESVSTIDKREEETETVTF